MVTGLEEWRTIPGFEDFEISETGAVRRLVGTRCTPKGLVLSPSHDRDGYIKVTLRRDKRSTYHRAHVLVAKAFIGPQPEGLQVGHKDGCRTNNHFSNLKWCTAKENADDRRCHGRTRYGSKNGQAKITAAQALEILLAPDSGSITGRRYGIHESLVHSIRSGGKWRQAITEYALAAGISLNFEAAMLAHRARKTTKPDRVASGDIGLTWRKQSSKWQVSICIRGRRAPRYVGVYDTKDAARAAYAAAKAEVAL